jgi:hypothetical protein
VQKAIVVVALEQRRLTVSLFSVSARFVLRCNSQVLQLELFDERSLFELSRKD